VGQTATLTITYTASVPPNTTGLRLTVDCPTCDAYQRSVLQPRVCLAVASQTLDPNLLRAGYLQDCPRGVAR
ncbi:hypothetical protein, partial [Thermus sp.]|uniref:hypothetical protein n=1 Tax=Thermus sp. TaxID=275 RepID=UPI00298EE1B3